MKDTAESDRARFLLVGSVRMTSSICLFLLRKRPMFAVIALASLAAATGCHSTTTAPTTSTAATSVTVTETFKGSIQQTANASFPFTVTAPGNVQVSLTDVEPLTTMALGVAVGTWDGTTCTLGLATTDHAKSGATALTGNAVAGNYCVQVSDAGNIPPAWTVSFTVQVTHS